jgi:molecular chaperone GrpE
VREEDVSMPEKEEPAYPRDDDVTEEDAVPVEPTTEELLVAERDRYMRLAAEFDNFRKRTERDMTEFRKRATENVLLSVLDVVDNLDRALETSDSCTMEDLVTGLHAIRNQMGTLMQREAIEPIEAVGRVFDPFCMEAVVRSPSDEVEEGVVVTELQKGYKGPGHVLRPSKVVVSSGPREDAKQ